MDVIQLKRVNSSSVDSDNISLEPGEFLIDLVNKVLHIGTESGVTSHIKIDSTTNLDTKYNGTYGGKLEVNKSTRFIELKAPNGTTLSQLGFTLANDSGKIVLKDTTTGTIYATLTVNYADNAYNVTTKIGSKKITDIFETDGVTAKEATHADTADAATNVTSKINGANISDIFTDDMVGCRFADSMMIVETAMSGFSNYYYHIGRQGVYALIITITGGYCGSVIIDTQHMGDSPEVYGIMCGKYSESVCNIDEYVIKVLKQVDGWTVWVFRPSVSGYIPFKINKLVYLGYES